MTDDYTTFSGIALERWFRQKMVESCRYRQIGGWWTTNGKNANGEHDDFEIDIVAETLYDEIEAYEVKRNAQKYNPNRLAEKPMRCNITCSATRTYGRLGCLSKTCDGFTILYFTRIKMELFPH